MAIKKLFILFFISYVYAQDRKISSRINPGLDNNSTEITLVHVKAEGAKDAVHQIWDFTQGIPTTIFAITTPNATLDVAWDRNKPRQFNFSVNPIYSFATILDQIYEYNDRNAQGEETGEINDNSPKRAYETKYLKWNRTQTVLTDKEAYIEVETKEFKAPEGWRSGVITVKLDLLPYKDYAVELPHLIHTANSTLVDVRLANMTLSRDFNASRFALHYLVATTDDWDDELHFNMRKSLDDEHTPGVFEIMEIKTPESFKSDNGGFIQFRPVGYTAPVRSVTTSTNAHLSRFYSGTVPPYSTLATFFGPMPRRPLVEGMYVSFGDIGDGCYKQTNYTAWSYTIGYGLPPIEGFSFFVIMVICIGLGVPVVLALSGITYVFVRKYKQRNSPSRLTNED